ncbi:hypothetical protein C9I28_17580 [Pseudoduganella armeniaca]|uniref:Secreted protein n=1 Tax=Pseudoduganella armeniaca TaxID=2072590 RepID=A0A2R4CCB2_9BURK|nr:hypothetical protein C9I28_17580 [Pseudoduganella armeniaca]
MAARYLSSTSWRTVAALAACSACGSTAPAHEAAAIISMNIHFLNICVLFLSEPDSAGKPPARCDIAAQQVSKAYSFVQ